MRRHLLAGAAIDDDRLLGTEPSRGAGDVDCRVAAAIDDDAAAQQRRRLALHRAQKRHGIEDLRGPRRRNIGAARDVGADREEGGIEAIRRHHLLDVVDLGVEFESDTHRGDARHLGVDHVARQAIFGNAEAHHAAGHGSRIAQHHRMPGAAQVISRGQARRSGTHHKHTFAGFHFRGRELPALGNGEVAEEAFHGIDAHGGIDLAPVAGAFAGVIADPPHDGGQRVVGGERPPGILVVAALGMEQPALDVLARGAGGIAGRQAVDIFRADIAP